uniref:Probable pectate lyase F n=1 Tax=Meloidogyne enterolobii TaxID=390850 RepID=A0A6V7VUN3_MELEN|nr:unnamed protein product [Meloidogyne enterolobii]
MKTLKFFPFIFYLIFQIIIFPLQIFAQNNFCQFPQHKSTPPPFTETLPIKGHVDFEYALITAAPNMRKSCDIKGAVDGQNILQIEDGGSISNVIIDDPAKGIWCEGSCTLTNVFFTKTCYHAVDFGNSQDSSPKIYQIFTQAGAGKTIIQNFCAEHFSKVWRSCGEYCFQHTRRVEMTNSKFKGPGLSLIGLNSNFHDTMYINNVKLDPSSPRISFGCQQYFGTQGPASPNPESECLPEEECNKSSCNYKKGSIFVG